MRKKALQLQAHNHNTILLLEYIRAYIARHGRGPTLREMAEGACLSSPAVYEHLHYMQQAGWIKREYYKRGSIRVLQI